MNTANIPVVSGSYNSQDLIETPRRSSRQFYPAIATTA